MSQNGVITLQKRIDEELTANPAVVYEVGCTTDQPTRVRLRDSVPSPFDGDDITFADGYHDEDWTIDGDEVVFQTLVEPDEQLRTLFGVETSDPSALTAFLSEPTVEMASGTGSDGENWGVISADLVDMMIDDTVGGPPSETATDGSGVQAASGESIEQFARQLDGETLTAEQSERIRTALGLESVASMDARIEHCQQQLSDLSAYVDALETFLDEEGSGRQLVKSFRADVDTVESELESLNDELTETTDEQTALRGRVDELETAVESLQGVRDDVVDLEDSLAATTTDLVDEIGELRTEIDDLQEWQEGVVAAFEGLQPLEES